MLVLFKQNGQNGQIENAKMERSLDIRNTTPAPPQLQAAGSTSLPREQPAGRLRRARPVNFRWLLKPVAHQENAVKVWFGLIISSGCTFAIEGGKS
ncbi:hypothetical protein B0E46_13005 [Rhodanobacter sp. B04]|uniref:hypothetical protein n=1 Tax=Rhodanobacter sp. B04 TaxID=1945860 RepID=UPI0009842327|nr:hypothetical protein [Rhodanobacter sp. B04]OOG62175.1 hypothetical protein B0E46_13005 [Rhodanobacter sp. B04]